MVIEHKMSPQGPLPIFGRVEAGSFLGLKGCQPRPCQFLAGVARRPLCDAVAKVGPKQVPANIWHGQCWQLGGPEKLPAPALGLPGFPYAMQWPKRGPHWHRPSFGRVGAGNLVGMMSFQSRPCKCWVGDCRVRHLEYNWQVVTQTGPCQELAGSGLQVSGSEKLPAPTLPIFGRWVPGVTSCCHVRAVLRAIPDAMATL